MFSGIIEAKSMITEVFWATEVLRLKIEKPPQFDDIKMGDSVCVNGVCLTVEEVTSEESLKAEHFSVTTMTFTVGSETLQVTGWKPENLIGVMVNLERSLKVNDRLHGHWVTGHVDFRARVHKKEFEGENLFLEIELDSKYVNYFWAKGSVTVQGVSLTINKVVKNILHCCLIPETLRRSSLGQLSAGDFVNIEIDNLARGLISYLEHSQENRVSSKQQSSLSFTLFKNFNNQKHKEIL